MPGPPAKEITGRRGCRARVGPGPGIPCGRGQRRLLSAVSGGVGEDNAMEPAGWRHHFTLTVKLDLVVQELALG